MCFFSSHFLNKWRDGSRGREVLFPDCQIDLLKNKKSYSDSIRYIRQRLSFSLLKTIIVSRRGFRGTKTTRVTDETDYNLLCITDYYLIITTVHVNSLLWRKV